MTGKESVMTNGEMYDLACRKLTSLLMPHLPSDDARGTFAGFIENTDMGTALTLIGTIVRPYRDLIAVGDTDALVKIAGEMSGQPGVVTGVIESLGKDSCRLLQLLSFFLEFADNIEKT
jgi:hypothetical protein